MSIDKNIAEVKLKKGPVDFKSDYFMNEYQKIAEENKKIDRASRIDYTRLHRTFDI